MSTLDMKKLAGPQNRNLLDVRDVFTHRPNCRRAAARAVTEARAIACKRPDLCPHGVRIVRRVEWRGDRRVIRIVTFARS